MAKLNAAALRRLKKDFAHFAHESPKIDLQLYLQNREARYLKSAWAEHSRLNGTWKTAKTARLIDLLLHAPTVKGRPADARRNVDITRHFLCLQAIQKRKVEVTREHMRTYPDAPVKEYVPISNRKLWERIAKDRNMTRDHVRNIVTDTLRKLGKGGPQGALLLERAWR